MSAVRQLDQLLLISPRAGVIYSWLFKYAQQHTAGYTENNISFAPHSAGPESGHRGKDGYALSGQYIIQAGNVENA